MTAGRFVGLGKGAEQFFCLVGFDADARVNHIDFELVQSFKITDLHCDMADVGELDGVVAQVEQNLFESGRVGSDMSRYIVSNFDDKGQPFGCSRWFTDTGDILKHVIDVDLQAFYRHLLSFNLGKVEDIVDQRQQVLGIVENDVYQLRLFVLGDHAALDALGKAYDGGERGSDLVAHVGQKGAFGLVGRFRDNFLGFCGGLWLLATR